MILPTVLTCPACAGRLDAHTSIDANAPDVGPSAGDVSVCLYCATALRFGDELELEVMTIAQLEAMPIDAWAQLTLAQHAVTMMPVYRGPAS
jgi:hypothetical protein